MPARGGFTATLPFCSTGHMQVCVVVLHVLPPPPQLAVDRHCTQVIAAVSQ